MNYVNVLLPVATAGVYTYSSNTQIPIGSIVSVPLGHRQATGICISYTEKPDFECKEVCAVFDDFLFPQQWLTFINNIASYYLTPHGITLSGIISKKNLEEQNTETPEAPLLGTKSSIELTPEQHEIVNNIFVDKFSVHLLKGVTGSGKTEVYLSVAEKVLAQNKKVIYLVPEISLTPQLVDRIALRLGYMPAVYHSKLTAKQRNKAFVNFIKGSQNFLIGPRSALFLPARNIGLIIIDEEHENTYKQENAPAYHLRDMAVLYGSILNIPVLLGSATPQVESYANAISGKYILHNLHSRAGVSEMPDINIIDEKQYDKIGGILSEPVYDNLYKTISQGKQAIIFLNRKGYATSLYCKQCNTLQECRNCSVPLTLYKDGNCTCHYCGEKYRSLRCSCGSKDIIEIGSGTEKVEEFIEQMFPGDTLRIDGSNITSIKSLNAALEDFATGKYKILIGTQLIAKGLHFPEVTFAAILGIDNILAMPDFRATERAFQLLMQVSGRSGRGGDKGTVYVQTCIPDNPLFSIIKHEPDKFYDYEFERRKLLHYPPYVKMVRIILTYSQEYVLKKISNEIAVHLNNEVKGNALILGPAPAVVYKIKNNYRYSIIIKAKSPKELTNLILSAQTVFESLKTGSIRMKIDRDPYFFM